MYLAERLDGHVGSVTRIARGIPVGGDLEYADEVTLVRALQGRRACESACRAEPPVSCPMSNLVNEILLRLVKAARGRRPRRRSCIWSRSRPLGASASVELALLCWLAAARLHPARRESPI